MTLGRTTDAAKDRTCMSCGSRLDEPGDYCDDQCQRYARTNGFYNYGAPRWARSMSATTRRDSYR